MILCVIQCERYRRKGKCTEELLLLIVRSCLIYHPSISESQTPDKNDGRPLPVGKKRQGVISNYFKVIIYNDMHIFVLRSDEQLTQKHK